MTATPEFPPKMTAYRACWELIKHCLKGRGSDEFSTGVSWDTVDGEDNIHGSAREFVWSDNRDGFCFFDGWSPEPPQALIRDIPFMPGDLSPLAVPDAEMERLMAAMVAASTNPNITMRVMHKGLYAANRRGPRVPRVPYSRPIPYAQLIALAAAATAFLAAVALFTKPSTAAAALIVTGVVGAYLAVCWRMVR